MIIVTTFLCRPINYFPQHNSSEQGLARVSTKKSHTNMLKHDRRSFWHEELEPLRPSVYPSPLRVAPIPNQSRGLIQRIWLSRS